MRYGKPGLMRSDFYPGIRFVNEQWVTLFTKKPVKIKWCPGSPIMGNNIYILTVILFLTLIS